MIGLWVAEVQMTLKDVTSGFPEEESGPIWLLRESLFSLGPLHTSPVDEPVSPWIHMRNFSPVSEMRRPKTSCGAKFGKQNKHDET